MNVGVVTLVIDLKVASQVLLLIYITVLVGFVLIKVLAAADKAKRVKASLPISLDKVKQQIECGGALVFVEGFLLYVFEDLPKEVDFVEWKEGRVCGRESYYRELGIKPNARNTWTLGKVEDYCNKLQSGEIRFVWS